jgi:hypothetical protein
MKFGRIVDMTIEAEVNSLVSKFIEQSRGRTEAWRKLNVPEYNRRVKQVVEIAKALRSLPDGRRALVALMSDADPYVRLGAAYHCLDQSEARQQAVATIRELATTPNIARDHASVPLWDIEHGKS